jgi:hypothetical protein
MLVEVRFHGSPSLASFCRHIQGIGYRAVDILLTREENPKNAATPVDYAADLHEADIAEQCCGLAWSAAGGGQTPDVICQRGADERNRSVDAQPAQMVERAGSQIRGDRDDERRRGEPR